MKIHLIFIPILFVALLFESTIISFPLIFISSVILFLIRRDIFSSILILIFALLLDSLTLRHLGFTSLSLFILFTIISVSERIFSSQGLWLGVILSFIGVEIYRHEASYPFSFVLFAVLTTGAIVFLYLENKKNLEKQLL